MLPDKVLDLIKRLKQVEPSRREAARLIASERSKYDAPPAGKVVGSDGTYDTSFWLAKIQNDEFGRRGNFPTFKLTRNLLQQHKVYPGTQINGFWINPRMLYAEHATLEVIFTTKEGVRAWTRWANKVGVTHDGKWGYIFPPKRVWNVPGNSVLDLIYSTSTAGHHKRSPEASARRREKRALKFAAKRVAPPILDPFVSRVLMPSKALRSAWHSLPTPVRWSDFRLKHQNKKVLAIGPVPNHRPRNGIPDVVIESLNRIYSRTVVVPRTVPVQVRLRGSLTPGHKAIIPSPQRRVPSEREFLIARLKQIEDEGFKESYAWFNLNHYLHHGGVF